MAVRGHGRLQIKKNENKISEKIAEQDRDVSKQKRKEKIRKARSNNYIIRKKMIEKPTVKK